MKYLWLFIIMLVLPASSLAQRGTLAVPQGADLATHPIIWESGRDPSPSTIDFVLSRAKGLRLDTLEVSWTGYNYHRPSKRFMLETLPIGAVVYTDSTGIPLYKADCGNRLLAITACPACLPAVPVTDSAPRALDLVDQNRGGGFWANLWDWIKRVATWLARAIMAIILVLGALLLLLALLALLLRAFDALLSWIRGGPPPRRATPHSPPPPPPPPPPPAPRSIVVPPVVVPPSRADGPDGPFLRWVRSSDPSGEVVEFRRMDAVHVESSGALRTIRFWPSR